MIILKDKSVLQVQKVSTLSVIQKLFERLLYLPLNDLRGDSINYVNNCAYRYVGYKQFTWWVHNYLGKGVRKVIPSCAK